MDRDLGEGDAPVLFIADIDTDALDDAVELGIFRRGFSGEVGEDFIVERGSTRGLELDRDIFY